MRRPSARICRRISWTNWFGYGQAIPRSRFSIVHGADFRAGVPVEKVLEIRTEDAPAIVKPLYARVAATRHGNPARTDELWRVPFSDHQELRDGASNRRFAVHQDGYMSYRLKGDWGIYCFTTAIMSITPAVGR